MAICRTEAEFPDGATVGAEHPKVRSKERSNWKSGLTPSGPSQKLSSEQRTFSHFAVLLNLCQSMSSASSPSFSSASFFAASDGAFVLFRSMVTLSIFPVNLLLPFG